MGIQNFKSIINTFGIESQFLNTDLEGKKLYIDFNSIIHNISQYIINKINDKDYTFLDKILNKQYINKKYNVQIENTNNFNQKYYIDLIIIFYLIHFLISEIGINLANFVYISIDGVPSVGKMIEQRQRKFLGKFQTVFKKKIIQEKLENISSKNITSSYTENDNISWDKINISPGTSFMKILERELIDSFQNEHFIISTSDVPGEGEHKISKHIKQTCTQDDNIYIYSPDNDANLLAMINNESKTTYVFKIDTFNEEDNFVFVKNDINKFKNELLLEFKDINKENKNEIINNIVLIYSFFGNDFIPSLESIDIKTDMLHLISTYKNILNENINFSLFNNEAGEKYKFHFFNFLIYLNKLVTNNESNIEHFLLKRKYFNSKFFAPKKGNNEKLNNNLLENIDTLNEIFDFYLNKEIRNKNSKRIRDNRQYKNYIFYENTFNKPESKDTFIKNYNNHLIKKNLDDTIENKFNFTIDRLYPFNDFDLKTYFSINKIYDLGNFKDENGYDNLNIFENNKIEFNNKNFGENGLDEAIVNYIFGINWILEVYFNQDYQHYNYWFYPFEKSPLITDILNYRFDLNQFYDENGFITQNFLNIFNNFKNDGNDITQIEQILFTTPDTSSYSEIYSNDPNILKKITDLYEKLYPTYKDKLYFDMEKEVENLFKNNVIKQEIIDCGDARFFNKCSLNILKIAKEVNFKQFKLSAFYDNFYVPIDDKDFDDEEDERPEDFAGGYYKKYLKYKRKYLKLKNLY